MARVLVWLGVGVAVIVSPGLGHGQAAPPRVSIGPFSGARAEEARAAVDSALARHAGEIDFVPGLDYMSQAQSLDAGRSLRPGEVARVARALRLDYVVLGDIGQRGRDALLALRVVRGRDGSEAGQTAWVIPAGEGAASIRGEVWDRLAPFFFEGRPLPTSVTAQPGPRSQRTSIPSSAGPVVDAPESRQRSSLPATTPGLGWLYATLGGGISQRYFRLPVFGEPYARGYDNSGFGEVHGDAMLLYRWADDRMGFGAVGSASLPVAIRSRGTDEEGQLRSLPTSAFDAFGGLVLIHRPAAGGWMRAHAGLAYHQFRVDASSLPVEQRVPTVTYIGLRAGGEAALPLAVSRHWELDLLFGAELRLVNIDQQMRESYGDTPGATIGVGGMVGANIGLARLMTGLSVRATAELVRYRTTFAGRARIGPGSEAIDDYYRYQLAVVYAFGAQQPGGARSARR